MNGTDRHGSEEKAALVIDGETGKADDTPGTAGAFGKDGRRIDLSNLRDVRIELAKLYRRMDAGDIASTDGSRRAFVLKTIHDVIVSSELERRLQDLEDRAGIVGRIGGGAGLPRRLN